QSGTLLQHRAKGRQLATTRHRLGLKAFDDAEDEGGEGVGQQQHEHPYDKVAVLHGQCWQDVFECFLASRFVDQDDGTGYQRGQPLELPKLPTAHPRVLLWNRAARLARLDMPASTAGPVRGT